MVATIPSILLFVSEIMPFLPTRYNGTVHLLYEMAKDVATAAGVKGIVDDTGGEKEENKGEDVFDYKKNE